MRTSTRPWRILAAVAMTAVTVSGGVASSASGASAPKGPYAGPVKDVPCDKGSLPEKTQGRAPAADFTSGRAAKGYTCNARQISHFGTTGGYRVERYVDKAGHECAFYDSTLLFPTSAGDAGAETTGTYVMDMSNPAHPVHTDTLRTPAFQTPHESVRLNVKRGLLVADMGYPTANPGFVDVFDVSKDCRHPVLDSSSPMGVLGHEGGFSPDGNTFWVASLYAHTLAAVDLTNPQAPVLLWASRDYSPHGVSISNDGNRLYMAEAAFSSGFSGLTVLDVSQVQKRVLNPTVTLVSRLTWPQVSTPQNATPFTRNGHKYLLETDEFGSGANIGAARLIDIQNEKKPFVVSNLRLAVNDAKAQGPSLEGDPGNDQPFQGYQGHYCSLPSRVDPNIVACSFIMSGLRVFDIRDPKAPKEVAYFNKPLLKGGNTVPTKAGAFAMSAPAYDEKTHDIWYSDGNTGFYVVRLTKATGIATFASHVMLPGN
ncbi:MAG: hypothetical protein QOF18_556 [Frankiaceae bacterium]|nr:hypothetical protein [Frankiaceae bacterium]